MKAVWNNKVLAESNDTIVIEGNYYFPPGSIKKQYFIKSTTRLKCPWKGIASYYTIKVDGKINNDAAWYYPKPNSVIMAIKDYVAFWKDVEIKK